MLEMRQANVVVQRWDSSCGAGALATLLTYQHNDPVTEKQIVTGMLHRDEYIAAPSSVQLRGGFSLLDMQRFAERLGYRGLGYGGLTLEHLIEFGPTIVPVLFDGYPHFVVFRGVYQNRVLMADPAYGNRSMLIADFERAWQEGIGFVVRERGDVKPPSEPKITAADLLVPRAAAVRASALR